MSLTKATYSMIQGAPVNVVDFGAVCDGVTDDTAAIVAALDATNPVGGTVYIPYNCLFDKTTVYGNATHNVIIADYSSINTAQPPGYKNKIVRTYSNDTASNDSSTEVASSHHPTFRLNNLATAGTSSATLQFHSIVRSAGFRWNNDPIDGMQWLTRKSPRGDLWRSSDVLNTPYNFAVNYTAKWTATTVFAAGAKINTSNGSVWSTVAGGTSGTVEPSGTGPTFSDGSITWDYQGEWNVASTRFYYDEDGYGALIGSASARFGVETATSLGCSINVNSVTGDTFLRDDAKSKDIIRRSDAAGNQIGGIQSFSFGGNISGATPNVDSNLHVVANGSATNMTGMTLPTGQTAGYVVLFFNNGNTTLKASGGNFSLKGGIDVTPAAGQIMAFVRQNSLSSTTWFEMFRSF